MVWEVDWYFLMCLLCAEKFPFRRQKFIYTNINNISENQMYQNEQIHRNTDLQARLVEVSQATFEGRPNHRITLVLTQKYTKSKSTNKKMVQI